MKKYVSLVLVFLLITTLITGCTPAEKTTVRICTIAGPTGVGMVNLMAENEAGNTKNNYSFSLVTSPQTIIGKLASGEVDIAAMPTNVAAVYNSKIRDRARVLAVNTLGVLSILENGTTINKVSDLKGATIYSTGRGSNPEYILNYILTNNGIDPDKDINIQYLSENEELAAKMVGGDIAIALVPEPIATAILTKNTKIRRALDLTEEWDKVSTDSQLMMGCVVSSNDYISKNKAAVNRFLKEYKASIEAALSDIDTAAALSEKYKIIPSAAIAKKAIPNCNLVYIDGSDMKTQLSGYYKILYKANKRAIGGSLPSDQFYYKK